VWRGGGWYRFGDYRDRQDRRILIWNMMRVEIVRLDRKHATVKLLDYPQWRKRRVHLGNLYW
jgi:hypothetical protein